MSIRASTLEQDPLWDAGVVIVGSGAGGAVWAERLSERGKDVLLLEEGGHFTKPDFNQREDQMYRRLYRDAGNQLTADQRVSVLQGKCVGGSTVINMADIERIPPEILSLWRKMTGIAEFEERRFTPYFERCEAAIGVNTIPEALLNANNQALKRGSDALKLHGSTFRHNRVNCVLAGYCLIGCSYDAKRSTLVTRIPNAEKNGARLAAECRVTRVDVKRGKAVGVSGLRVHPVSGKPVGKFTVRADTVVLAAGAIHTPMILQKSGITGGPVGENLSLQPQLPVMVMFKEEIRSHRGIPQAYYMDHYETHSSETGMGGFRLEGISAGPAMSAAIVSSFGNEHKMLMKQFLNTGASLLLVPDRPGGSVKVTKGTTRAAIDYAMKPEWVAAAREGLRTAVKVYAAAGAQNILFPFVPAKPYSMGEAERVIDGLDFNRVQTISAHPQGTCRIGTDPHKSVVNPEGKHHQVGSLFVVDASLFPTTASTHTMIPVMAMADWLADKFLAL